MAYSTAEYKRKVRVCFPGGENLHRLTSFDFVNFLLKTNDGRDRRPNFAVLVK